MSGAPFATAGAPGSEPERSASSRRSPSRSDSNQRSASEELMPFRLEVFGAFHGFRQFVADLLADHGANVPEGVADVVLADPHPRSQLLIGRRLPAAAKIDRGIEVELERLALP